MQFTTIFIDLDGTLYSNDCGLWQAIRERISTYMRERMGFSAEDEARLRSSYLQTYGTTLRGLQINHHVDPEEFLAYVHDIPLEKYLRRDPVLHDLLKSLPQSTWIFTNADSNHAWRVMKALGVQDCFTGIIDIRALNFICKPQPEAYHKALILAGEPNPQGCILLDDALRNLTPAREIGFYTILVNQNSAEVYPSEPSAPQRINSLHELLQIKPDLRDRFDI
jgi:putative hydrolase of the HAD superfamily